MMGDWIRYGVVALCSGATACLGASAAQADERRADERLAVRPYLSLEAAQAGLEACLDYARETDLTVAVSIRDRAGREVVYARMDDTRQKPAEFARMKSETSATTGATSLRIGEIVAAGNGLEGLTEVPGLTRVEGGVPITLPTDGFGDYLLGGVGVSGASPAEDGVCAARAAAAIVDALG